VAEPYSKSRQLGPKRRPRRVFRKRAGKREWAAIIEAKLGMSAEGDTVTLWSLAIVPEWDLNLLVVLPSTDPIVVATVEQAAGVQGIKLQRLPTDFVVDW